MKKLFLITSLLLCSQSYAWNQREPLPVDMCHQHSPYGFPVSAVPVESICREGYLVGYDADAKIPRYVTYLLTPNRAVGCVARTNAFAADQSIASGATPDDYVGSGYDKGHQSPNADQRASVQGEMESFLMTNMAPQLPGFNRATWKLLETSVRGWVLQYNQPFVIYIGSVYDASDKRIGNGVVVPHAFYKIVINSQTNKIAGWWFPHSEKLGTDLTKFRMPIALIEQQASVNFSLPLAASELAAGKEWTVNFGTLTAAKKAKCSISSK